MLKKIKKRFGNKNGHEDEVAVKGRQGETWRERAEAYTEAVTFAEAGLQDEAQAMIRQELAEKPKLLVVGHETNFSDAVIDYAVSFAARMGYDIIALNVAPVRARSDGLEPFCDLLCEQFEANCQASEEKFRRACEAKGVGFTHLVKFGELDDCIKEVHREWRRVEFVVTEPETCTEEGRVGIPVFCMTS